MNNKKIFFVIIFAAILALAVAAGLMALLNDKQQPKNVKFIEDKKQEELLPLDSETVESEKSEPEQIEPVQEAKEAVEPVKKNITSSKAVQKTVYKKPKPPVSKTTPIKKPEPAASVNPEEQNSIKINFTQDTENPNEVVVPCEYKFKSPAKYSFK